MTISVASNPVPVALPVMGNKGSQTPSEALGASMATQPNTAPKPVPEAVKININTNPLVSSVELETKISALNEALVSRNQAVAFNVDSATGRDVVSVINRTTGELIRQMPTIEALKSMQNMDQMMGLIFNKEV
jgi:flagellar protein FlaG